MDKASIYFLIPLFPLIGALIAGFFGRALGKLGSHLITILGVTLACIGSFWALFDLIGGAPAFNGNLYTWLTIDGVDISVGFLVDNLTATMMCVVTFVSLMVHIYTIGYMHDDDGYQRFFSYISLFTFSMLMLVMSNNFVQLFFGWEAVGLVSYLLIGFWFKRPTAIFANLKAFLVNRVGDLGFLLGIGLVYAYFGSFDYATVFQKAPELKDVSISLFAGTSYSLLTATCILLFVGAMGKSAQFPLHVWLPDSMEGPTPISALIHAATMVTAGIFMVARMSSLFELSDDALNFVMVIGAITALFMGILGIIQNDIKRVVAYSTLSQLGYMTVALGASAYSVAIFHLFTHAFFKALLFLAAGSVIIGMHHDQDIRNMGGLRRYMPITWITSLLGSLALIGTPFFSGFYSKDSIIEAVHASTLAGASFAYIAVIMGVFITAFYSFRMYFMVFHGEERFAGHGAHGDAKHDEHQKHDEHHHGLSHGEKPVESPWVIWLPLVLLAIPSVLAGYVFAEPFITSNFLHGALSVDTHHVAAELRKEFHGATAMALHGVTTLPFFLAVAGVILAWFLYLKRPDLPSKISRALEPTGVLRLLENKYYMDHLYINGFSAVARGVGKMFWKIGDTFLIDGLLVNGGARLVSLAASLFRGLQTGFIYHYAFAMIIGVSFLLGVWIWGAEIASFIRVLPQR